jgi:hypothetical protein
MFEFLLSISAPLKFVRVVFFSLHFFYDGSCPFFIQSILQLKDESCVMSVNIDCEKRYYGFSIHDCLPSSFFIVNYLFLITILFLGKHGIIVKLGRKADV